MAYIYKITNITNSKIYVGSTIRKINRRWNIHKSQLRRGIHGNRYLQRSWNKYGENNFQFDILEECDESISIEREQHYKILLKAEYNIAPITESFGKLNKGRKLTEEHKEKIRRGNTGKKMPEWFGKFISSTRSGINHPLYGTSLSVDTRNKISIANKGIPKPTFTETHLKNLSLSHIGLNQAQEHYNFGGRYTFSHPIYGDEILGRCEWSRKYNNSKPGKIYLVCRGKRKSYKGWTCKGRVK